jgi:hypothetical protein
MALAMAAGSLPGAARQAPESEIPATPIGGT